MDCRIEKPVLDIGVKAVFATIKGVNNASINDSWMQYRKGKIKSLCQIYKDFDAHTDAILEGYNILHDKSGVKRRKNIPSSENLIKLLRKHNDLPFINQVVDIYNLISLDSRLCISAHDLDQIDGNLTVRFSNGTETYIPLGQEQPVPMNPHEYCYCDDSNEVLCRLEIRQVNKTKVDETVKNVLYIIEGNDETDQQLLLEVMQEVLDTTTAYCGGIGEILVPEIITPALTA